MEFIEGEGLDNKIDRGPLALKEALGFARQVADGLAAAHAKGVVHRDIKPGNLLVTPQGRVKILDFGLALLTEGSRLTKLDTTVGTVAYMSPEQAQGMEVDYRTDIWALGCVTYEMVRGQRPFQGVYDQALVYEIVNQEPEPLTGVRTGVPMELDWMIGKCLAKDREDRYNHAEDMMLDLRTLAEKLKSGGSTILRTGVAVSDGGGHEMSRPYKAWQRSGGGRPGLASQQTAAPVVTSGEMVPKRKLRLPWAVTGVAALVALAVSLVHFRETPPESLLRRFAFTPPAAVGATTGTSRYNTHVAISPNGKHIAFADAGAEGKLWVQDLDQQRPRAIDGTDGASTPFWSPGSDFIGFAAGGEVRKVSVQGGLATRLCQLPGSHFHGGSWSPDGEVIVFSSGTPHNLYEVPARGGTPNLLISPGRLQAVAGRADVAGSLAPLLAFRGGNSCPGVRIRVCERDDHDGPRLRDRAERGFWGPAHCRSIRPAAILSINRLPAPHDLWALPFSLETLKADGEAFPISENSLYPTVAGDQTLVYLDGTGSGQQQLVWLDRRGEKMGQIGQAQLAIRDPVLSPDGRAVAVSALETSDQDVWIWNIARGVKTRLSSHPERDFLPVWSPTGEEIAFSSNRAGNFDIFLRQADGGGEANALAATARTEYLSDWSRDGKNLLYARDAPETGLDLWRLERAEDGSGWEPHPFLQTPFRETAATFSPDGRYVAYLSHESGQDEIYVQPFPESGRKLTVSSNGGRQPRWARDGKELFYVEGSTLVAVSVSTGSTFSVGAATRLFEHPGLRGERLFPQYDISADGQRFILAETVGLGADAPKPSIHVVQNWFAEFRDQQGGAQ